MNLPDRGRRLVLERLTKFFDTEESVETVDDLPPRLTFKALEAFRMSRSRERILTNLEEMYREAFERAKETGDPAQMAALDFSYRREQLYFEILLDVRDAMEKRYVSGGPGEGSDRELLAHWTPRPHPARVVLAGRYTTLEPLDPVRHGDALFAAAIAPGADERFRYLWDTPPTDRATFDAWTQRAGQTDDPLFFAVIDHRTGRAEGRQSLMRIDAANGVAEIGHILWGPAIARTRVTTEAFALMAAYVFETLGYRRFEWKCDNRNAPSKRAALRFGFTAEGLFRKHMIIKGYSRDTAWFAMTDDDWSVRRAAFAEWLAPDNFDETGAQRRGLAATGAAAP